MKKLGFGMFRLPLHDLKDQGKVDMSLVKRMVDAFLSRGYSYFDTAYMYHDGQSENIFRKLVAERYSREIFQLADKMPVIDMKGKSPDDQDKIFHDQLSKCGVDYFDNYLLHCLNAESYKTAKSLKTFEYLSQQKEKGKILRLGFSFHDKADILDCVLTEHPEVDFVQLQLNYYDWEDERVQSRKCYETAVRHGKPVIVMEPVKGGKLARLPGSIAEPLFKRHPDWSIASWAIRFAASLDNVSIVLSGMSNLEQVLDNTAFMENPESLDSGDLLLLEKAAEVFSSLPAIECTACRYCVRGCPKSIPIPDYFTIYNRDKISRRNGGGVQREEYQKLSEGRGKASDCIHCGQCEETCPQHLEVMKWIAKVKKVYEQNE